MAEDASSHLVLARKWRPGRLEDLVGQEHVTRILRQALASRRVAHAFLFCGIHGVGKTSAARILARCLNCTRGPTCEPCGECQPCVEISEGRSLDVVEIDGATYRKIDDARAIIENLAYRPARDRYKVYIIDEAHQLTDQAFNALLKTLEEPPAHVKFILATTEPQKMPETILSRLQRYDFRRIPSAQIVARLGDLAKREGVTVETGALTLIAREAGGSMRDAERMLETAVAMAPDGVRESEVAAALGVASRSRILALVETILNRNPARALHAVRQAYTDGARVEALGHDLLETIRNLAHAKLSAGQGGEGLLDTLPDQEATDLSRLAQAPSLRDITRLFRLMAQAQEEILRSPYPELLLEMAVVRMATLAPVLDADEPMRAIERAQAAQPADRPDARARSTRSNSALPTGLRDSAARRTASDSAPNIPSTGSPQLNNPTERPQQSASPQTQPAESVAGLDADPTQRPRGVQHIRVEGEVKADAPRRVADEASMPDLPELREYIRSKKGALAAFMEHGASLALEGDTLVVTARDGIYVRYFNDHLKTFAELASQFYRKPIAARMRTEPSTAGGAPDVAAPGTVSSANDEDLYDEAQTASTAPANAHAESDAKMRQNNRASRSEALKADPVVRMILDQLDARLVSVRSRAPRAEIEPAEQAGQAVKGGSNRG